MNHHDMTSRQKGYARYLLKLNAGQRNNMMAAMRPALRSKMRNYVIEAQAEQLQHWNADVRGMYLRKLHRENAKEFNQLMSYLPELTAAEYRQALVLN